MRTARSLLCTLVVIPLRLTAQAEPTTAPGDRVRVVAPVVSKAWLTGRKRCGWRWRAGRDR